MRFFIAFEDNAIVGLWRCFNCRLLMFLRVCSGEEKEYVRVVCDFVWIFRVLPEGCEVSQYVGVWPLLLVV